MTHPLRSVPQAFAGLTQPTATTPSVKPREHRLCAWCSAPCIDRDETGAPACRDCASETAAEQATTRRARSRTTREPSPVFWRPRQTHDFIVGEFRAFGSAV